MQMDYEISKNHPIFIPLNWNSRLLLIYYNMTVWIFAQNDINFSMAAGYIGLHMPGVK